MTCRRCGAFTQQRWDTLLVDAEGSNLPANQRGPWAYAVHVDVPAEPPFRLSTCLGCNRLTVWAMDEQIFPVRVTGDLELEPHEQMPEEAAAYFREAVKVWSVSPRAGAALARAALEVALKELDRSQKPRATLDDRLAAIASKVPSDLGALLLLVRHGGNKSVHHDPDDAVVAEIRSDDTGEMATLILEALNELVGVLVERPARIQRLIGMVPQAVRDGAERKAAAQGATDE